MYTNIDFYFRGVFLAIPQSKKIKSKIISLIKEHKFKLNYINYIFCNDEYLYSLNCKYLHHNTYTDIITFDNSVNKSIESDIFISIDRIEDNYKNYNTSFKEEFYRVIFHGLLHLIGYNDKSVDEKIEMRKQEDEIIQEFTSSYKKHS